MQMASPMASLHSLCQDNCNEVQHDFFSHVIPLAPVLASPMIHKTLLGQDIHDEVELDLYGYAMPLALAMV